MTDKRKTNLRSVRIDHEVWDNYVKKAQRDHNETPAAVMRALLEAWYDGKIEVHFGKTSVTVPSR